MKQILEKLDFSFSFSDFNVITELLDHYLEDRVYVFDEVFNAKTYSDKDKVDYIHYFIEPCIKDKPHHDYLERIQHFLSREYEIFNHPKISALVDTLQSIFFTRKDDYDSIEDFEDYEVEVIDQIYESWQQLYQLISQYPLLELDTFKYEVIDFVPIYYTDDSDSYVLNEVKKFVKVMKKEYPTSLRRLDSLILCDTEYIEFVAGEGTMAFFVGDNVFMPNKVSDDDKLFFTTTLYHEFGHFIYDLLPEHCQVLWTDYYKEWITKGIKLTREEGNDVEELFADVFSLQHNEKKPDYISEPSTQIVDTYKDVLERGFTK